MRTPIWTAGAVIAFVLGLAPAAGADQTSVASEGSDNVRHVANIAFPELRSGTAQATDSDFLEFTPDDDWVPPAADEQPFFDVPEGYAYPSAGETRVFNLMGTYNRGMYVTDVTDPESAALVSHWDCGVLQADVFVFRQGEGADIRQYAAYTLDATANVVTDSECARTLMDRGVQVQGVQGTYIADVTDPYRPQTVTFLPMHRGSHQTTVHPGGDYVYNSAAVVNTATSGVVGFIEVYRVAGLADGAEPELVDEILLGTGLDSHDMTFDDGGDRLYSAALTHSFVIDTTDPEANEILGRIYDPAINIHHDAHKVTVETPAGERDYMLIGDELAGAIPAGYCPGGGIHVYDVTGPLELAPVKVGAFFIPEVRLTAQDPGGVETCTAHVIQVLPGQELLVMAWYNAGVRVLDYSGLGDLFGAGVGVGAGNESATPGIQQVGYHRFDDSSLWSAKVHEVAEDGSFSIFGGDTRRTLDIWHFDAAGAAPEGEDTGSWMDPDAALRHAMTVRPGNTLADGYTPFCLLPVEE